STTQLDLEYLWIVEHARTKFLGNVTHVGLFNTVLQCLDDSLGQGDWCHSGRRSQLLPFVVERTGKDIDDTDTGWSKLRSQALAHGQCCSLGRGPDSMRWQTDMCVVG